MEIRYAVYCGENLLIRVNGEKFEGHRYYLYGAGDLPLIFVNWQSAYAEVKKVKKELATRESSEMKSRYIKVKKVAILEQF